MFAGKTKVVEPDWYPPMPEYIKEDSVIDSYNIKGLMTEIVSKIEIEKKRKEREFFTTEKVNLLLRRMIHIFKEAHDSGANAGEKCIFASSLDNGMQENLMECFADIANKAFLPLGIKIQSKSYTSGYYIEVSYFEINKAMNSLPFDSKESAYPYR